MIFPRPQSKQLRLLAVVSIFTAGFVVYSLWPLPTVTAKNQSKKSLEKNPFKINQVEINHSFLDVTAIQSNNDVQAAANTTDPVTQNTKTATEQTNLAAPQNSTPDPTAKTETTKVAINTGAGTQVGEQTQSALANLSETFMTNLWNPPTRSTQVYATDAFSPFTTRLLTLAAFLLIFSGAALRKFAYQKPKTAGAPLGAKKLAMSPNH